MKRLSPILLAILVLTGCHAPMPSFNLLAPYGPTRIPPRATGVAPNTYYQPSQQTSAPVGTGFRARQASTNLSAGAGTSNTGLRTVSGSDKSGHVTRATHEIRTNVPTTLVPARAVVNSQVNASARTLPPTVRGMRINEAPSEPARFYPTRQVIDISQLPPASAVRYANVVPINEAVGTSVAQVSSSSRNSSRSTAGSGGWHSRN